MNGEQRKHCTAERRPSTALECTPPHALEAPAGQRSLPSCAPWGGRVGGPASEAGGLGGVRPRTSQSLSRDVGIPAQKLPTGEATEQGTLARWLHAVSSCCRGCRSDDVRLALTRLSPLMRPARPAVSTLSCRRQQQVAARQGHRPCSANPTPLDKDMGAVVCQSLWPCEARNRAHAMAFPCCVGCSPPQDVSTDGAQGETATRSVGAPATPSCKTGVHSAGSHDFAAPGLDDGQQPATSRWPSCFLISAAVINRLGKECTARASCVSNVKGPLRFTGSKSEAYRRPTDVIVAQPNPRLLRHNPIRFTGCMSAAPVTCSRHLTWQLVMPHVHCEPVCGLLCTPDASERPGAFACSV